MRTPFGAECPYYYGDFHRGRQKEECRLLGAGEASSRWRSSLCRNCPVPRIVLANACPDLRLRGRVTAGLLGLGRRMDITASCRRSAGPVARPEVGCGLCHPGGPGEAEPRR